MFLSSSASACVSGDIEKKYDFSSKEMMNPEFVEHCRRLLLSSRLLPEHPSFGFFTELQNTVACQCCQKQSFFVRMVEKPKKKEKDALATSDESEISISHECYCVICYVDRFCNVHTFQNHDSSETHYIFKEKGSSGVILYQSSSVIKRV
jgi:hypothetical protein